MSATRNWRFWALLAVIFAAVFVYSLDEWWWRMLASLVIGSAATHIYYLGMRS